MQTIRLVFLASLLILSAGFAQNNDLSSRYLVSIESARQLVRDSLKAFGIPGASVSVSINGVTVWSEGFGFADLEQKVPVTPDTKLRVGSISKSMTSVAVGILYDEGKIDLDTAIQAYVPNFPQKRYPVSLRQVAGHIGGIRHYRGTETLLARRFATVEKGLEIFKDDSLLFEPGTRYSYSSYGWNLISAAIEGASGRDFLAFMNDRVFGPLHMSNTIADYSERIIPGRARWYTEDSLGNTINAPFVDNSYKWAGGGFLSTTVDLLKFGNGMLSDALLKPETRAMMFTPQTLNDGTKTRYGIGWFIRKDRSGRVLVTHAGGSVGGTANLLLYPEQGVVLAILVNSDRRFIHLAPDIAEFFLKN